MKIWVLIPAYNERETIVELLCQIKQKGLSTMVVDDGSSDDTFTLSARYADVALKNKNNLGKGVSLKRGIAHLLGNDNFDYILTMDGDGQHAPADIDKFIAEAEKGENFIVGNRMEDPGNMPGVRVMTNKFMSWFISKIVHQQIPDTQCGFRLISRQVLENIKIETNNFEVESEILIKATRKNFIIKSIPVHSIYSNNRRSKIHPFADTLRFIRFIFCLNDGKR
ncbi:MAG: glycosyltransferase family 2 protein [Candidatus Omnitrophica bacterium]|nr:glycosyltransferase family 2 protein [Candidatus Omnitrophota bacterium]